jgi:hypothetical protein
MRSLVIPIMTAKFISNCVQMCLLHIGSTSAEENCAAVDSVFSLKSTIGRRIPLQNRPLASVILLIQICNAGAAVTAFGGS